MNPELIKSIVADKSLSLDDRLEKLLSLSESDSADSDSDSSLRDDIEIYHAAIDMILAEDPGRQHPLTLMQLYVLLAETYGDLNDYRPMKNVAEGVLYLMRENLTPVDVYKETVPRLASALGDSVYNHNLYEILLLYVKYALEADPRDESVKPQAKKLLKLRCLLESDEWLMRYWDKELEKAVAGLFSPDELVRIIVNPKIGHLNRDRVEYTRRWEEIFYDLEEELNRRFESVPRHLGMCFEIWRVKSELLKERYGIDWKSPRQMNPRVRFD